MDENFGVDPGHAGTQSSGRHWQLPPVHVVVAKVSNTATGRAANI